MTKQEVSELEEDELTAYEGLANNLLGLLTPEDVDQLVWTLPVDRSAVILLLEHTWALRLAEAVRQAGGVPFTGGMVTSEAPQQVRAELVTKSTLGDFNLVMLELVASGGAICGDTLGYGIGRWWGHQVLNRLGRPSRRRFLSPHLIAQARKYFARRGGWAIFLSRFLLSSVGGEINLLAGANPYPFRCFVLADVSGEIIGAIIPLCLGYWVGASWEAAGDLLDALTLLCLGVCLVVLLAGTLIRTMRHMAHRREEASVNQLIELSAQVQQEQSKVSDKP